MDTKVKLYVTYNNDEPLIAEFTLKDLLSGLAGEVLAREYPGHKVLTAEITN